MIIIIITIYIIIITNPILFPLFLLWYIETLSFWNTNWR